MSWRPLILIGCLAAIGAQGLYAAEPTGKKAAIQWVQKENRKCPKRIRQWFEVLDKEALFEKELPSSALVKAEDLADGVKYMGREQLPSPPIGYQVGHLGLIRLGENDCCLASYTKHEKFPEGRSVLYLWQGHQWCKLLQNDGTVDDLEGIEFIRISPRHDPLVVVIDFGGGSGIGRTLYSIGVNGRVRRLLNIGTWNEGGYNLRDFDGDGVFELVHRSRIWHPASLTARLPHGAAADPVDPILYKDTIYRWKVDHFEVLGVRYWMDG